MFKKVTAEFISYLFHPVILFLLMPFLVVYWQTGNGISALKWQIFSSAFIFLAVIIIFMEIMRGDFSDFDISKKNERLKFYIIILMIGVLYLLSAYYFKGIYFSLSIISMGIAFGIIVFAFINRFIKASVHVCVATAFVITNSILFGNTVLLLTLWIVPLLAWTRLTLKQHTIQEVLAGGFLGIVITIMTFLFGLQFYRI